MNDWRGNKIKVGSRVVYPVRHGSALWVQEGVVEGFKTVVGLSGSKYEVLQVRGADKSTSSWAKHNKLVTVWATSRVTVVS